MSRVLLMSRALVDLWWYLRAVVKTIGRMRIWINFVNRSWVGIQKLMKQNLKTLRIMRKMRSVSHTRKVPVFQMSYLINHKDRGWTGVKTRILIITISQLHQCKWWKARILIICQIILSLARAVFMAFFHL